MIEKTADEMAQRVTTAGVAAKQHGVQRQHERADADSERRRSRRGIGKPHRFPDIVRENENEEEREVEKIAMHVLHDKGKGTFAEIDAARLADGAIGRIGPECLVIGATVIIAGESKTTRCPKDQERGRKEQPGRPPNRLRPEPGVR